MESDARILERKIIGVSIRDAREKSRRSVKQVADCLGITPEQVRQCEMGMRDISLPELEIIASYFKMPVSALLSRNPTLAEEPPPPNPEELSARRKMVGDRLRQARQAAGKSFEECCQAIGVKSETLYCYEDGQEDIPLTDLIALANFLQLDIGYFVRSREPRRSAQGIADFETWARLPQDLRSFVADANSLPFLRIAQKLKELPGAKLQELGEILLVVK